MFGHLKSTDFISLLDGADISPRLTRHLEDCSNCRDTIVTLGQLEDDVSFVDDNPLDHELASVDWTQLRSSVRDGLLARSVKRASTFRRWTGSRMQPAAAWSLGVLLLVSAVTFGGLRHYQTDHSGQGTLSVTTDLDELSGEQAAPNLADSTGLVDAIALEDLAWNQTDIFSTLDELESAEEEALRNLIMLAASDDSFFGDPFASDLNAVNGVFQ